MCNLFSSSVSTPAASKVASALTLRWPQQVFCYVYFQTQGLWICAAQISVTSFVVFLFVFVCVCVCEMSIISFSVMRKKTNIGFVTTKTSWRTATDLCYTDVTVFVLPSMSNAWKYWNRFSEKEKKDRCWFYYKFLQQQICAAQTNVACIVLPSSSNSWFLFSHEKKGRCWFCYKFLQR